MKILAKFVTPILTISFGLIFITPATAEQLIILDCNGITRLIRDVHSVSRASWTLSLSDTSGAVEVRFSNVANGVEKLVTAKNGVVAITGLEPGVWKACPANPGITVTDIAYVESNQELGVTTAALGGLGLVAGGVAAGSRGHGGSGTIDTQTPPRVVSGESRPAAAASSVGTDSGTRNNRGSVGASHSHPETLNEVDCGTSEKPVPLSPIS